MNILVFMNAEEDGLGTIRDYCEETGVDLTVARLYANEPLPDDPEAFDGIIALGGPMNVYEDARYPYLKEETVFLQKALKSDVPALGICLGAQLLARAAGARVSRMSQKEIGISRVRLTGAGRRDPLFRDIPDSPPVTQWHEDTFALPEASVLLASSPFCENQAFRLRHAWGVQFHPEVNRATLELWSDDEAITPARRQSILTEFDAISAKFYRVARTLWRNFLDIAAAKK